MKAITIDKFGGPEVLKMTNVPTPIPMDREVRIKISYASVNPVDWKIREGYLATMIPHHFPLIPGWDLAGVIESCGKDVTSFKVGDRVFSYARKPEVQWGTYAEFITLDESVVSHIPESINEEQAATIPLVGLTAWQALHDFSQIEKNMNVLVLGGSGGVGSFAIQFAKAAGASVWTTASKKNRDYVSKLGAAVVLDYESESINSEIKSQVKDGFDIVFDTVGGETLKASYEWVRKGGVLVSIVESPDEELSKSLGIRSGFVFVSPNASQLTMIAGLIDEEKVVIPEFQTFPLSDVMNAHKLSESRRTRGKILLKI
ncbi:MAG: NADP-dependent oxidoreductase [Bdellovibrionaceae bacterium]|nr:NADP-dependent oxidoreductase [Pseudobdellovibrionaceae bacterium]